jgi:hypothetical protein
MNIQPYDLVTDGRRTGIVMAIYGAIATVSWEPKQKNLPTSWAMLMRPIETTPLLDLRTIEPQRLAA